MLLLLLIEILGTRADFHTKSRNPPGQKLLVLERLVLPLLGRMLFSRSFDDSGVVVLLLLLLDISGWGVILPELELACRTSQCILGLLGHSPSSV